MIKVQADDFDLGKELKALSHGKTSVGAVSSFVGLVREMSPSDTNADQSMTLEHYPGMTEKLLADIENQAQKRWPLQASLIIHRYGRLAPGDQIVLVACASAHRQASIEACSFIMDYLKTDAPFWKLEQVGDEGAWVDARDADTSARDRWKQGG